MGVAMARFQLEKAGGGKVNLVFDAGLSKEQWRAVHQAIVVTFNNLIEYREYPPSFDSIEMWLPVFYQTDGGYQDFVERLTTAMKELGYTRFA